MPEDTNATPEPGAAAVETTAAAAPPETAGNGVNITAEPLPPVDYKHSELGDKALTIIPRMHTGTLSFDGAQSELRAVIEAAYMISGFYPKRWPQFINALDCISEAFSESETDDQRVKLYSAATTYCTRLLTEIKAEEGKYERDRGRDVNLALVSGAALTDAVANEIDDANAKGEYLNFTANQK